MNFKNKKFVVITLATLMIAQPLSNCNVFAAPNSPKLQFESDYEESDESDIDIPLPLSNSAITYIRAGKTNCEKLINVFEHIKMLHDNFGAGIKRLNLCDVNEKYVKNHNEFFSDILKLSFLIDDNDLDIDEEPFAGEGTDITPGSRLWEAYRTFLIWLEREDDSEEGLVSSQTDDEDESESTQNIDPRSENDEDDSEKNQYVAPLRYSNNTMTQILIIYKTKQFYNDNVSRAINLVDFLKAPINSDLLFSMKLSVFTSDKFTSLKSTIQTHVSNYEAFINDIKAVGPHIMSLNEKYNTFSIQSSAHPRPSGYNINPKNDPDVNKILALIKYAAMFLNRD